MKGIILLGCLVLFSSTMVFAQGKIEAPVWNKEINGILLAEISKL